MSSTDYHIRILKTLLLGGVLTADEKRAVGEAILALQARLKPCARCGLPLPSESAKGLCEACRKEIKKALENAQVGVDVASAL